MLREKNEDSRWKRQYLEPCRMISVIKPSFLLRRAVATGSPILLCHWYLQVRTLTPEKKGADKSQLSGLSSRKDDYSVSYLGEAGLE